jgi:ATP-dependent RNA helicase DeaD
MTKFKELGLNHEIMESLNDLGFEEPTPIQEKAIPFILNSKEDLIALAQTGTGKTAAFGLPVLNQLDKNEKGIQSIILCPTRELCIQISQDLKKFLKHSKGIEVTAVYGGESIVLQTRAINKGTSVVVGTPGRVCDLIRRKVLKLQSIKWLVLDEADEMLDMGFKEDLDAILSQTPETRQTLLFSATISGKVLAISRNYMKNTKEISVGEKNKGADNVSHEYYIVSAKDRFEALKRILDHLPGVYGVLFCRTKNETQEVADKLKRSGYDTEALHGDVSQVMRTRIMDRFKKKDSGLLVATDVAARGIDINNLTHVINYNLPDQNESYTHRSGRTGRASKSGVSISISGPRDTRKIKDLERIIGKSFELKKVPSGENICSKQIDKFLEEIESIDFKEIKNESYFLEAINRLEKVSKEDLIKGFINHKFSDIMNSYKDTKDLNVEANKSYGRVEDQDSVALQVNVGRKQGLGVKELLSLINSDRNLRNINVGKIELMSDSSVFSLDKEYEEAAIKHLTGKVFGGVKITITVSTRRPSSGYSGRRDRSGRGGNGNRRGGSGRRSDNRRRSSRRR